jgi:hypothetical protein
MLRIVVMVLVAANLLYFGWTQTVGRGKPQLTTAGAAASNPEVVRSTRKATVPAGPPPCATLGPFLDPELADTAEKQLKDAGWGLVRRSATEQVVEGWWVYVPNTDAAAQARTLDILRRWNMRDAVAMADDPEFRVSVGIYSLEARAEDRAQLVQRLKLDAKVAERYKPQASTWFDIPGVARATLADGRLKKTGLPLEKLRIEACPVPASAPANGSATGGDAATDGPAQTGIAATAHPGQGAAARGV